jgi:hypothetical protein
VTKFSPKRQKTPKISKKKNQNADSGTAVFSGEFNFDFFGRGKTNFWGGITSKLASQ